MTPENSSVYISIASLILSMIGAVIAIYKAKPEKKKLEADGNSSIADAAESIAGAAKITNEQLLLRIDEMNNQVGLLKDQVRAEHDARLLLEEKLLSETQSRIKAERRISYLQVYINELQKLMDKANLTPPPMIWPE